MNDQFVQQDKTPEFIGQYEKIKDHWPAFVAYKKSDKAKNMSLTNKQNAAKKKYHHVTGSGGYEVASPAWEKAENDLLAKGIQPETLEADFPDRGRTWFFGHGGTLHPETGRCIYMKKHLETLQRFRKQSRQHRKGGFIPIERRTS